MVLGNIFIFIGVAILISGLWGYRKAKASANWPEAQGKIEASEVKYIPPNWWDQVKVSVYSPQITYSYVVNGIEYHSNQISIARLDTAIKDSAQDMVEKYPIGSSVAVRYDPQNPGFAFLEAGESRLMLLLLIGSVMLIIGVVGLILIPKL